MYRRGWATSVYSIVKMCLMNGAVSFDAGRRCVSSVDSHIYEKG